MATKKKTDWLSRYPVTFSDLHDSDKLAPVVELDMVGAQQAADYLGVSLAELRRMWSENKEALTELGARLMTARTATFQLADVRELPGGNRAVALTNGQRWVVPKQMHHYYTAPAIAFLDEKLHPAGVAVATPVQGQDTTVQVFDNPEFGRIRTLPGENGKILFCGTDVAIALGYSNHRKAVRDHTKGGTKRSVLTSGGFQTATFITEGDVYRLVARSKLPTAEKFESWVFDEVLPSIRKTGSYTVGNVALQEIPRDYPTALRAYADEVEKREALAAKIEVDRPKVEFATQVSNYTGTISVGTFAKLLSKDGFMIGRNKLYAWMRNNGILDKNNAPYQAHMEAGYLQLIEVTKYGYPRPAVRITGKGQLWLHKKIAACGMKI